MRVLWITNLPSPYRVAFFNELGKMCDLTVLFETSISAERDASWGKLNIQTFQPIFLKGLKIGVSTAFCPTIIKYISPRYDRIVLTNFSTPTGMLAVNYLKWKKIPYCIESDGGFPGNGVGLKEKIKRWILPGAEMYFSTAKVHDEYYMKYGVDPKKIVRYPFTSIYDSDILSAPVSEETKYALRNELCMREKKVVISVGRFIHQKGYDVLLDACRMMEKDIGFYIIGGKPTDEYKKTIIDNHMNNIHFIDFMLKAELNRYLMAADIFVLPTRGDAWGLVVNEAMSNGLPVVTTDRCVAGLEMVRHGENGYIVPIENSKALAEAMIKALDLKHIGAEKALCTARQYTIEKMAKRHYEILSI